MLNTRHLGFALAAGVLVFSAWTAQAQSQESAPRPPERAHSGPGNGGHQHEEAQHLKHMLKVVGATDAQRDAVKKIAMAAHEDMKSQRQVAQDLHREGMALFTAAKLDPAAIEAHRQKTMAFHDAMSKRRTQMRIDIANVFTPEQRAKLASWMQAHPQHDGHEHGKGEHGHD